MQKTGVQIPEPIQTTNQGAKGGKQKGQKVDSLVVEEVGIPGHGSPPAFLDGTLFRCEPCECGF